jgi:hypothetical protein
MEAKGKWRTSAQLAANDPLSDVAKKIYADGVATKVKMGLCRSAAERKAKLPLRAAGRNLYDGIQGTKVKMGLCRSAKQKQTGAPLKTPSERLFEIDPEAEDDGWTCVERENASSGRMQIYFFAPNSRSRICSTKAAKVEYAKWKKVQLVQLKRKAKFSRFFAKKQKKNAPP